MWHTIQSIRPRITTFKDNIFSNFFYSTLLEFFNHCCFECHSIQKTKYTTRCSVKSSTIYKLKFILIVYFLFSKKSKTLCNQFLLLWKTRFFTRTRIPFSYFTFASPNMSSLKKTKYTTRCSVKSSTVYKEQFILFVYFYVQKNSKFCEISFRNGENWSHRVLLFLKTKSIQLK